jgi:hypothetical protein
MTNDSVPLEAVHRLIGLARDDSRQARQAANYLLSWWNAETCGGFDIKDLHEADPAVAGDIVMVTMYVAKHNKKPTDYGLDQEFAQLVAQWRPHLAERKP